MRWHVPFLAGLLLAGGCFHATIETGLAPSPQVIDNQWAHGFLWGLVPPSTVETASKCPHGVARVETQHSFLNGLVYWITWGIYSPIEITVTCAASGTASTNSTLIRANGDGAGAIQKAAEASQASGQPAYVQF